MNKFKVLLVLTQFIPGGSVSLKKSQTRSEHAHIAGEKRIMDAQRRMCFMTNNNRIGGGGSNAAVVAIVVIFLIIIAAAIFFGGQFISGGGSGSKKVDVNVKAPAVPGKSP